MSKVHEPTPSLADALHEYLLGQHPEYTTQREPHSTKLVLVAFEGTAIVRLVVSGHIILFYRERQGRLRDHFMEVWRGEMSFMGGPLKFDLTEPESLPTLSKFLKAIHDDYLDELRRAQGDSNETVAILAS